MQLSCNKAAGMSSVAAMSRTERRTRAQAADDAAPMWARDVLTGFGLARVRPDSSKWFAFKVQSDGTVTPLTPLFAGELRGEGKPNATGRLKLALLKHLGGVDE